MDKKFYEIFTIYSNALNYIYKEFDFFIHKLDIEQMVQTFKVEEKQLIDIIELYLVKLQEANVGMLCDTYKVYEVHLENVCKSNYSFIMPNEEKFSLYLLEDKKGYQYIILKQKRNAYIVKYNEEFLKTENMIKYHIQNIVTYLDNKYSISNDDYKLDELRYEEQTHQGINHVLRKHINLEGKDEKDFVTYIAEDKYMAYEECKKFLYLVFYKNEPYKMFYFTGGQKGKLKTIWENK